MYESLSKCEVLLQETVKTGSLKFSKTNKCSSAILTLLHYMYFFILNFSLLLLYELNTILRKGVAEHKVKASLIMFPPCDCLHLHLSARGHCKHGQAV
jgi:hypothetical protein